MDYLFDEKQSTPLCEIMGRNQSDKGSINITMSWHNYTTFYYSIFKDLQDKKLRIFELGLGTNNTSILSNMGKEGRPGASLYGWSEFFPNSEIFGADIDSGVLFNTERINTFFCDQTKPEIIKQMWEKPQLQDNFDIIIEDGLHTFNANVCFFENSIHKLNLNGYYIIEDILLYEEHLFINKIIQWEKEYDDCLFTLLKIPSLRNNGDNNLLVVYKSGVEVAKRINTSKKQKCVEIMEEYFMTSNEIEKEKLLQHALRLNLSNLNVLVHYGMKLIYSKDKYREYCGYSILENAFDIEPPIPIHCYQGKWLATMIGRYNHLMHKYETSEKYFTLANSSTFTSDDTNNIQLATSITGYPTSIDHAEYVIEKHKERIDELLEKKNINISFVPNSAYNFLILSPFNFEVYYEANIKECMHKHYLLGKKIYPKLHYISPKIKKVKPSLPYKLGIASAFFTKNNSVIADFGGMVERLPRDMFDITFIYIYENGKNESTSNFIYPNEKHILINTDMYENEEWLYDARKKIENLNLDLLFYLDSTMSSVIQRVMMSKLAAKQAVSHGHPVTSGIPSNIMNYYISWGEAEIETAQEHYTEELILLRKGHMHQYYKPRIDLNGNSVITGQPYAHVTREYFQKYGITSDGNWYVCMQKPFKLHPEFDYLLEKICVGDKSAKIILHESNHEENIYIFKNRFRKFINNIYFVPMLPHHELMGLYNVSDVVLDSYYAGGCTTTREALEIGAIVVTLPGKYLGGRWSLAYYNMIGVLDLVAKNKEDYVNIALKYGMDKEENNKMKETILNNVDKLFYSDEAVESWVQVFKHIIQS